MLLNTKIKDSRKNTPLCIMLSKMSAYRRDFDETKQMSFLIKKITNCQEIIMIFGTDSAIVLRKGFGSERLYNEIDLKVKIKYQEGNVNTYFHNNKMPKEGSPYIFLSVVLIDSDLQIGINYYPPILLEKYKYIVKVIIHITEELEISSREKTSDKSRNFENTT